MKVPVSLTTAFGESFERLISDFAVGKGLLPEAEALRSRRHLTRSIVPHIQKLSARFNRVELEDPAEAEEREGPPGRGRLDSRPRAAKTLDQGAGLDPYWKESSNPENLRLAYFLYFMPANLYRVAAVWAELARLGYRWPQGRPLKAIELGAGPAAGACGIAAGEHFAPTGLPKTGDWALIEQDKAMLDLGRDWAGTYFADQGFPEWGTRPFHRKLSLRDGLLPERAPRFDLWVMSYFLNEFGESPAEVARALVANWQKHLADEGIVLLVEPALRMQSRKLLEIRRELIRLQQKGKADWMQILLPCLGHQACGALAGADDWCHEQVSWWRPPYYRQLDAMAGLDRKTLPFSYLVITRSKRPRTEILPALAGADPARLYRLVSPAHSEGQDREFFVCGWDGKRRARYRPLESDAVAAMNSMDATGSVHEATQAMKAAKMGAQAADLVSSDEAALEADSGDEPREEADEAAKPSASAARRAAGPNRGDILVDAEIRGDVNSSRIERIRKQL